MPAAFATSVPSSLLTLSSFGFCERPTSWFSPASQSPYLLSPLFRLLSLWVQVIHPKLSPFLPPHTLPGVTGTLPLLWGCLLIPLPTSQMLTLGYPLCRYPKATSNSTGPTELSLFLPKHVPPPGFPIFKNGPHQKLSTNTHCHVMK